MLLLKNTKGQLYCKLWDLLCCINYASLYYFARTLIQNVPPDAKAVIKEIAMSFDTFP